MKSNSTERPSPFTKVPVDNELSPFKFMGILPQRVKLSKIYDGQYLKPEDKRSLTSQNSIQNMIEQQKKKNLQKVIEYQPKETLEEKILKGKFKPK